MFRCVCGPDQCLLCVYFLNFAATSPTQYGLFQKTMLTAKDPSLSEWNIDLLLVKNY